MNIIQTTGMYFRATIMLNDAVLVGRDALCALARTLETLFGDAHVVESHCVEGEILVEQCDIELIHGVLEEAAGVDVRIGLGRTPILASIALLWSDRPGITYIDPNEEDTYLAGIPVAELDMVPAKTARQMRKFQIFTAYDIKYSNTQFISLNFDSSIVDLQSALLHTANNYSSNWYKQLITDTVISPVEKISMGTLASSKSSRSVRQSVSVEQLNLFTYSIAV